MDVGSIDEIDSRPSDAIALALKFAVPIYVNEDVMNEVSFIPEKDDDTSDIDQQVKHSEFSNIPESSDPYIRKVNKLQSDLKTAIDSEDYEKAASIRDEIKKLELSR